ncbi:DUF3857 and transglutaminase domain-containing protein [Aurantibacter crassamenti]|uniref:DUF3857 domain-containing protein n=1 Tax=Aurantibacter crassamenti TaxID=1837375 RepID=UPI00193ABC17|nr:DUF3857 domain-containing protein [Aurantibacter crassamenti]MBM1108130.1 DUF3857 and transglutaminase domain-containing protein [Aurantibacter crassamenti]
MRLFVPLISCLMLCFIGTGQENEYQSLTLDKSLTNNANAVVRLDETIVEISSKKRMTVSKRRVITILKKTGQSAINPYAFYDPVTRINNLSVIVYDKKGKEIEELKKKDFKDVSAVDGGTLYGDSRVKYFEYTPIEYPYTIDFTYSYDTSNTVFLPKWSPVDEYLVSTEKSTYKLTLPTDFEIRKKEKNFENYPIENRSTNSMLSYSLKNIPASKREMLSPAFYEIEPQLLVSLSDFHLEGVDGQGNDWASMGKWQFENLLIEKDIIPESTKNTVGKLVSGIDNTLEKTKKIYQYVQDNTRYISVQLGIGGWMPIEAAEVDRVKYGDCKGLTNYTKALLKSQGIESYYSVVWAGNYKRSIEPDFASMEGNHVILNVPNEENDIWLECTSQSMPFGFLSSFTDDRDVLVITPNGGVVKRTDAYLNEHNSKITTANFALMADGSIKGSVKIKTSGIQYDRHSRVYSLEEKKKDEYYKEYWDNINGLKVDDISLENNKSDVQFVEKIKLEASGFASLVGNELLFNPNPFDQDDFVPDRYRNRKFPFQISRGYLNESEFTISLPEGFDLSEIPTPIEIEGKFGSYKVTIGSIDATTLIYKRKLLILSGKYSKEDYTSFRDFKRAIAKGDNLKMILKSKI